MNSRLGFRELNIGTDGRFITEHIYGADDLQHPYIYRGTNGSWTNVEYNDGVCHYYYSYNSYDQNTKLNITGAADDDPSGIATYARRGEIGERTPNRMVRDGRRRGQPEPSD